MYKIGDFSKITGASITTLRYYDEIELLIPDEIDIYTGYRYYSDEKLEEYKTICDLKSVGFSLEEIRDNWNKLTDEIMLNKKQELLKSAKILQKNIRKVDYLRSLIKNGKITHSKKEITNETKIKRRNI